MILYRILKKSKDFEGSAIGGAEPQSVFLVNLGCFVYFVDLVYLVDLACSGDFVDPLSRANSLSPVRTVGVLSLYPGAVVVLNP